MLKNKDKYGKQYKPKNHQKNNIHINNWNKHNFNDKQCICLQIILSKLWSKFT